MSFYESDEYENYESVVPENSEYGGLVTIPGIVAFADIVDPGQFEDYASRYQLQFRVPKGNPQFLHLLKTCELIATKTWGDSEGEEKLADCWDCIDSNISPKKSNISIQDGDNYQPEYNVGCWVVKASRRPDEGRPSILDKMGRRIFDLNKEVGGEVVNGELVGDESQIPKMNDIVWITLRVWGQKKHDRLNFSLQGLRLESKGTGSKRAIASQTSVDNALAEGLPALDSGFLALGAGEDEESPKKKSSPKKRAAKKAAPKKKAAAKKKAKSVFRKR